MGALNSQHVPLRCLLGSLCSPPPLFGGPPTSVSRCCAVQHIVNAYKTRVGLVATPYKTRPGAGAKVLRLLQVVCSSRRGCVFLAPRADVSPRCVTCGRMQVLAVPAEKKERALRRWAVIGSVVVAALAAGLPKLLKK
jgi:hypothetical protein